MMINMISQSRPKEASLNVRPFVCPFVHKSVSDFKEISYADRGRWVIHNSMPAWPDPGLMSRSRVQKLWKWSISKKSISSASVHVIKWLMVNTIRQCLNFNWTDFWYLSSFCRHVTLKRRLFQLWQMNFAVAIFRWIPLIVTQTGRSVCSWTTVIMKSVFWKGSVLHHCGPWHTIVTLAAFCYIDRNHALFTILCLN